MEKDYQDKIDKQENADYNTTKHIFSKIFKDKFLKMEKRPKFSVSDAFFSAQTKDDVIAYSIEVKEVSNTRYLEENGFVLKMTKYIQLIKDSESRNDEERVYIIYLIPYWGEYYLYNLKNIDLNKIQMAVLNLKTTQFNENAPTTQYAVMFLPLSQADYVGYYQPNCIF